MSLQPDLGSTLHALSNEEAYAKVDVEIADLETRIRSLKTLRNTISPISHLPNELLGKVFLHSCAHDEHVHIFVDNSDEDCDEIYPNLDQKMRWVVSWVSRHWRVVALASPQLWDLVNAEHGTLHSEHIRTCSLRSKDLGLRIDLTAPDGKQSVIDRLSPHITRIRSLLVAYSSSINFLPVITPLSEDLWTQPAPTLHSLSFDGASFGNIELFNGETPQIRRVHMITCAFNWDSKIISASTITVLMLTTPVTQVPVSRLKNLLSGLPALTKCWLRDCIDPTSPLQTSLASRVSLPCLRTSWFSGPLDLVLDLLGSLHLPRTSVGISVNERNTTPAFLTELIRRFQDTG